MLDRDASRTPPVGRRDTLHGVPDRGRQRGDDIGKPWPYTDLVVGPGEPGNQRFGELLERLRRYAGLSRAAAATKLGFSTEYLRLIEAGRRTPAYGQMQNLLDAYGAKGEVGRISPEGYRQDLAVFDPPNEDEPVIVEFTSRIREARHKALGGPEDEDDTRQQATYQRPAESRAAQIGLVVSLLARADDATLRSVRKLLEDNVGCSE
jgi:transcriptional regulator with XRE-family HTH domain